MHQRVLSETYLQVSTRAYIVSMFTFVLENLSPLLNCSARITTNPGPANRVTELTYVGDNAVFPPLTVVMEGLLAG